MASGASIVAGLAGRYATALFELALEAGALDAIAADLKGLEKLLAESTDFKAATTSPLFGRDEQAKAMAAVLDRAGAQALTKNFVGLLAEKRRLFALGDICVAFRKLVADHRGEVTAEVVSARPLNDSQLAALKDQLRSAMGRDIQVESRVDAKLIGGLVVKVGSRMIDASLATRLANLEHAMKKAG